MTNARPARFVARAESAQAWPASPAGVCPGALAQLDGYRLPDRTVAALQRMGPSRQVAAAQVMVGQDNCSGDLARALLAATPASQRVDDPRGRQSDCKRARRLSAMEKGLAQMQDTARAQMSGYRDDLFCLALTASFVRGWICEDVVRTWLQLHYPGAAHTLAQLAAVSDSATVPKRPMRLPYQAARKPMRSMP
ncbi:plasmid partitioning protein RepB C-terminal domain-containing protein [Paraburkholderia sediminicola]|uniref:plasmid partitioning protein RepB C-terminal domain-containing protein n=1 Tax=Paraburkholderia sediminicola TaxID=458836 RepID=UPI0038BBF006